ncbi:MAG TPA: four helix bundle protein [Gemmatimonadales bacterium]|nr:four helix bundle protein [Gemmatimonadales bacterium]
MGDFHELEAWRDAVDLAVAVYRVSGRLPSVERFGLTSQLRRAAVSISANIAEGCGRTGDRQLGHFLRIARGSASEVESLLVLCVRLELLTREDVLPVREQVDRISRRLTALLRRLTAR